MSFEHDHKAAPIVRTFLHPYMKPRDTFGYHSLRAAILVGVIVFCFVYGFAFALMAPFAMVYFAAPIAILAGLSVWALPDTKTAPVSAIPPLFWALFVASVVWPYYLALKFPGMPLITVSRLIGVPLIATMLICVSSSAEFRRDIQKVLSSVPIAWKLLVAFAVIQFLTIVFSNQIGNSLNRVITNQLNWTAVFFLSCFVFLKPGRVQVWAAMLWVMAIVLGLIGVWEHSLQQPVWAGHIPGFLRVDNEIMDGVLTGSARAATGKYRVQSVFTTSLTLSEYMALTMPFVLHFIAGPFRMWVRVAALATVPFLFHVVLITDSRLGMVGSLLAILLYVLAWSILRWRRSRGDLLGPSIVLSYPVLFCAAVAATFTVGRLRAAVWGNGPQAASDQSRKEQWIQGLPKILENPLGHGPGMSGETLGYANAAGKISIDSYFLSVILEYGVLGFAAYFALILVLIYNAGKLIMSEQLAATDEPELTFILPVGISLSCFFIIKAIFAQQDNHYLVFMMLGMVLALYTRLCAQAERTSTARRA